MDQAHPLSALETTDRALHRAQTETFAFRSHEGAVLVRNLTYEAPAEHEYRVTVADGVPTDCTCPAEAHYAPACKHRIAVAIRDAVLDAAVRMQVAADGGTVDDPVPSASGASDGETAEATDCDCSALPDGAPCWPCFRDGRAEFRRSSSGAAE